MHAWHAVEVMDAGGGGMRRVGLSDLCFKPFKVRMYACHWREHGGGVHNPLSIRTVGRRQAAAAAGAAGCWIFEAS